MKKLLLIMLITIVVISCKKEEPKEIAPVEETYITIDKWMFQPGKIMEETVLVYDDNVYNSTYHLIGLGYSEWINEVALNTAISVRLPKSFTLDNNTIVAGEDSIFRIELNKFKNIDGKVIYSMYPYTVHQPERIGSLADTSISVRFDYHTPNLQPYRKIVVTIM